MEPLDGDFIKKYRHVSDLEKVQFEFQTTVQLMQKDLAASHEKYKHDHEKYNKHVLPIVLSIDEHYKRMVQALKKDLQVNLQIEIIIFQIEIIEMQLDCLFCLHD